MRCFYNLKSGAIKTLINFDSWIVADEELWEEEKKEIEENWTDYYEFEGMSSRDSFLVMADFVHTVDNQKLKYRLLNALNKPKPFGNFKWQIDNSGKYRQKWFDYKQMRYVEWVKKQIEYYNIKEKMNE